MTESSGDVVAGNDAPEDEIGARIAERRQLKGLTHDGLAKLTKLFDQPSQAGVSRTTIRGYEVGMYKPGTRELRLLSQALEVTPTWLIFGGALEPTAPVSVSSDQTKNHTELQKFLIALTLLRAADAADRQVVYDVLHSLARLRHGETDYRATVIVYGEMGALMGDIWADLKETGDLDQEKVKQLLEAYGPVLDEVVKRETGRSISEFRKKI